MKIVLIPDSFKGTLTAPEACRAIEEGVRKAIPDATIDAIPVADGGEGTTECLLAACGGARVYGSFRSAAGAETEAYYGVTKDGVAVVETAQTAGFGTGDVLRGSTYGVGQMILRAARGGAARILVGLGGSCTNDFGCGAAAACGAEFFRADGTPFLPTGATLGEIARIDLSRIDLCGARVEGLYDADNPPVGPRGAAAVFAPQKGADAAAVALLETGGRHVCSLLRDLLGRDVTAVRGGGAAGGLGVGLHAFFGAALSPGIERLFEATDARRRIADADLVLTGEGRLDAQTLGGKAVLGAARAAKEAGVPCVALVGGAVDPLDAVFRAGVTAVFPINRLPATLSESGPLAAQNLSAAAESVLRLFAAVRTR